MTTIPAHAPTSRRLSPTRQLRSAFPGFRGASASPAAAPSSRPPLPDLPEELPGLSARKFHLSPQKAVGLFCGGLLAGVAGQEALNGLFALFRRALFKPEAGGALAHGVPHDKSEKEILTILNEGMASLVHLTKEDPNFRYSLFAWGGVSVLVFLTSELFRYIQEPIIREAETNIRGDLLNGLTGVVRESIRQKRALSDAMTEELKHRLQALLRKHRVPSEALSVSDLGFCPRPQPKPSGFVFEPAQTAPARFGHKHKEASSKSVGEKFWAHLPELAVFGVGALIGFTVSQVLRGVSAAAEQIRKPVQKGETQVINRFSVGIQNMEALFVRAMQEKNPIVMLLFLGAPLAAKTASLAVDAFRQIEVTRRNAETEYRFQRDNWLKRDLWLQETILRETMEGDLARFERNLLDYPGHWSLLQAEMNQMIAKIRSGSPGGFDWWLKVPQVQLTDARA